MVLLYGHQTGMDEIQQAAHINLDQATSPGSLGAWMEAKDINEDELMEEVRRQVQAALLRQQRGQGWYKVLMGLACFAFQMGYTVAERRTLK